MLRDKPKKSPEVAWSVPNRERYIAPLKKQPNLERTGGRASISGVVEVLTGTAVGGRRSSCPAALQRNHFPAQSGFFSLCQISKPAYCNFRIRNRPQSNERDKTIALQLNYRWTAVVARSFIYLIFYDLFDKCLGINNLCSVKMLDGQEMIIS